MFHLFDGNNSPVILQLISLFCRLDVISLFSMFYRMEKFLLNYTTLRQFSKKYYSNNVHETLEPQAVEIFLYK